MRKDEMRKYSPPLACSVLLFLGAAIAPLLFSIDDRISVYGGRQILSNASLYNLKYAGEYSHLQKTDDIDSSVEERARVNDDEDRCSRLFLYLPDPFAFHGHGSQINTYIMGVTTATYLNRAMLLVESPLGKNQYPGGSQFGCPIDSFRETVMRTSTRREANWEVRGDFPLGFSRLVRQPAWLSHGCDVPCADTHRYTTWLKLANAYTGGEFEEITCRNPDGSMANVVVSQGGRLRSYFREHETLMTRDHPSEIAERWAMNLGATPREAKLFSDIKMPRYIWDYTLGLMNKAGFFQLQPWIARDVKLFLKSYDLPLDEDYSAIHVRRGDKLLVEARNEVAKYWRRQGYEDINKLPTDYIPFAHYLSQWDGPDKCHRDENGEAQVLLQNVYVATDDPLVVREEIAALPNHIDQNTILWRDCHQLKFFFNPTDDSAFHLNGDGEGGFKDGSEVSGADSCFGRYHRNIASMADMIILAKARTFIGEYNSNWGRVIRAFRVRLNLPLQKDDAEDTGQAIPPEFVSLTKTLDTRIAFGQTVPKTPGK